LNQKLLAALKWEWTSREEKYRLRSSFIFKQMSATATRLSRFSESVIRGMTRLTNQYGAINLAQGFPDFDPPEELLAALERATPASNQK
jgi:aspartate/methionine/tyrosine aminotransferase